MVKTLSYSGLIIASSLIILMFVTATSYPQLAIAAVFYPLLIFLALKLFPRSETGVEAIEFHSPHTRKEEIHKNIDSKSEHIYIADIDKRNFIKLIGATGISFFLFSLLGRRVDSLFFGGAGQPQNPFGNNTNAVNPTSQNPFDGYKISQIDDSDTSYFGFTNADGAWLIMSQDSEVNSFRYAKGTNDFPTNWKNRSKLKYDYYYNIS